MSDVQTMAKAALVAERRRHERELTALRQQVADLRAALVEHEDASRSYLMDADRVNERRLERALIASTRVLAATQPQEVQG